MTAKVKDPYPLLAAFAPAVRAALIAQFERGEPLGNEQAEALGVPYMAGWWMSPVGDTSKLAAKVLYTPNPARMEALGQIVNMLTRTQEKSA